VMRQMVLEPTIYWCGAAEQPVSIIGPFNSASMTTSVSVFIEGEGNAVLGVKVQNGGCTNVYSLGYFLWIDNSGNYNITGPGGPVLKSGTVTINSQKWTVLSLQATPSQVCGFINGASVGCVDGSKYNDGFAAIGSSYNYVQFDDFSLNATILECAAGTNLISAYCESGNQNQLWKFNADGTIQSLSTSGQCISAGPLDPSSKNHTVTLAECDASNPEMVWYYDGFHILNPSIHNGCLRLLNYDQSDCVALEVNDCSFGDYSQNWWYNSETNQIIVAANVMCITSGTAF